MLNFFRYLLLSSEVMASVSIPFKRTTSKRTSHPDSSSSSSSSLAKRATTHNVTLYNDINKVAYMAELSIGTPSQNITAQIDTGSSDLWVFSAEDYECNTSDYANPEYQDICDGIFNPDQSSTFKANSSGLFYISYVSGAAEGNYAEDTIVFAEDTLKDANFAVVNKSESIGVNVFGIGFEGTEASEALEQLGYPSYEYRSIPYQLKSSGAIDRVAYSLWLNDKDANGELLFGAIDSTKFSGNLTLLPFVPIMSQKIDRFAIMLNGISLANDDDEHAQVIGNFSWPFILDSGTTLSVLPEEFISVIAETLEAEYDEYEELYVLDTDGCSTVSGSIGFNLSGFNFEVPLTDLTLVVSDNDDQDHDHDHHHREGNNHRNHHSNESSICYLALEMGELDECIFGDNVLRSLYTVFDLESKEAALAMAKHNITSSSIQTISSSIPSATKAESYSSTQLDWRLNTTVASSLFSNRTKYFSSEAASGNENSGLLFPTATSGIDSSLYPSSYATGEHHGSTSTRSDRQHDDHHDTRSDGQHDGHHDARTTSSDGQHRGQHGGHQDATTTSSDGQHNGHHH